MPTIAPVINNPLRRLRACGSSPLAMVWCDTSAAITPRSKTTAPIASIHKLGGRAARPRNATITSPQPRRMAGSGPCRSLSRPNQGATKAPAAPAIPKLPATPAPKWNGGAANTKASVDQNAPKVGSQQSLRDDRQPQGTVLPPVHPQTGNQGTIAAAAHGRHIWHGAPDDHHQRPTSALTATEARHWAPPTTASIRFESRTSHP